MMMSREIAGQGKDLDQRQRDFVGNVRFPSQEAFGKGSET